MCTGPESNFLSSQMKMEALSQEVKTVFPHKSYSNLLELAAADDLAGFIHEIEEKISDINEPSLWYCRTPGSKKMGLQLRTPIMIASSYNSIRVLQYIINSGKVNISLPHGLDGTTPLHCATAAGSWPSVELLIASSADPEATDAVGLRPRDVVGLGQRRRLLETLLGGVREDDDTRPVPEKKEYPLEVPLPDINEGVYGTDEFRMYSFKVRPCSRAYSHDWTECPFAHPGENARRRDPLRHCYTPVPCPEFKKGGCPKGDGCEYAHGVFESWLHPAQYRTRLCKDEMGCSRRVCFFAHRTEELRPLYASTGSGLPSPKSSPPSPPFSPSVNPSSPIARLTPPALHLAGSRLRTAVSARDLDLDLKPTSLESVFGSPEASLLSHMQGLSPKVGGGVQLRASYPTNSGPNVRKSSGYGFDSSAAVAAAVMGSRSVAFAKRSQSFIDRSGARGSPGSPSLVGPKLSDLGLPNGRLEGLVGPRLSDWGSPDGRLDWGFSGEEASKLRKSASFGIRSGPGNGLGPVEADGPDVSWVNSLVKDVSYGGVCDGMVMPQWVEQMYMEQEQMVA